MVTPRSIPKPVPSPKKEVPPDATWDRVKHALERDWQQTRTDFTNRGTNLHQHVTDTVKQAMGKEVIPPPGEPNASGSRYDWVSAEPAVRYGFSAFQEYGSEFPTWNEALDRKLERGWNEKATGRRYEDVRHEVKVGWQTRH
jgi:hypothetical protein